MQTRVSFTRNPIKLIAEGKFYPQYTQNGLMKIVQLA